MASDAIDFCMRSSHVPPPVLCQHSQNGVTCSREQLKTQYAQQKSDLRTKLQQVLQAALQHVAQTHAVRNAVRKRIAAPNKI